MPWSKDNDGRSYDIKQIALSHFNNTEIVIIALIIFLLAFVALVVWAMKRPKEEIEEMEMLPLEDDGEQTKEESK